MTVCRFVFLTFTVFVILEVIKKMNCHIIELESFYIL